MTPLALIEKLTFRGVEFRLDGDKLCFYPREQLTPQDVAMVRQHKAAIVNHLARWPTNGANTRVSPASFGGVGGPPNPQGPMIDDEFWWSRLIDVDYRYLTSPRRYPAPCLWCGGRLAHNPLCDELRHAWQPVMPFGKHKGVPLPDVPRDYLVWAATGDRFDDELREAIQHHLQTR